MGHGLVEVALVHGHDAQVGQRGDLLDPVAALAGGFQQLLGHRDRAAHLVGAHDTGGRRSGRWALRGFPRRPDDEEESVGDPPAPVQFGPAGADHFLLDRCRFVLRPCEDEVGLPFTATLHGLPAGEHPRLVPAGPGQPPRELAKEPDGELLACPRRGRGGRADPAFDRDLSAGGGPHALPVLEVPVAIRRQPEHDPAVLASRLGKDPLGQDHLLPVRYPGSTCLKC